jgi:hypothetical protein
LRRGNFLAFVAGLSIAKVIPDVFCLVVRYYVCGVVVWITIGVMGL